MNSAALILNGIGYLGLATISLGVAKGTKGFTSVAFLVLAALLAVLGKVSLS